MIQHFYNLLAGLLANDGWLSAAARLDQLRRPNPGGPSISPAAAAGPVSIWQPRFRDGELVYTRPAQSLFGDHYAARQTFHQAKAPGVIRICYFGESAALGYLYAPHFSPAAYLEEGLNAVCGEGRFEVIDLSMTNETLASMVGKIDAAMQLRPDVCIVFAGNNWALMETPDLSPRASDPAGRLKIADILVKGGLDGLADHVVKTRLERIGRAFWEIGEITGKAGAHVIAVLPEANLADWESRQPVPFHTEGRLRQWHGLYDQCRDHLENEAWPELLAAALEMWALDQGSCSTTYRLIAAAQQHLGETEKARAACRAEIDSVILPSLIHLNAPQVTSYDQALVRRLARGLGFDLVDVPEVFSKRLEGKLPGKDLFLDYCHYTETGIGIIVTEIAEKILPAWAPEHLHRLEAFPEPAIPAEHRALAYFGAAIHTAHRLLPVTDRHGLLKYWCGLAYQTFPAIAGVMRDFVRARAARIPAVLTEFQQRMVSAGSVLLHSHGWKYPYLDIEIILAIQDTLKVDFPEIEAQFAGSLIESYAVENWDYDLAADAKFLWNPLELEYLDLLRPQDQHARALLRSSWPRIDFVLISEGMDDLDLMLAARVPHAQPGSRVTLEINGRSFGSQAAEQSFHRRNHTIPREHLSRGINRLTIRWPYPAAGEDGLQRAVRRLRSGQPADLAPVFGEIFSLQASAEGLAADQL